MATGDFYLGRGVMSEKVEAAVALEEVL